MKEATNKIGRYQPDKRETIKKFNHCDICGIGIGESVQRRKGKWITYNHEEEKAYNWEGEPFEKTEIRIRGDDIYLVEVKYDPDEVCGTCKLKHDTISNSQNS